MLIYDSRDFLSTVIKFPASLATIRYAGEFFVVLNEVSKSGGLHFAPMGLGAVVPTLVERVMSCHDKVHNHGSEKKTWNNVE